MVPFRLRVLVNVLRSYVEAPDSGCCQRCHLAWTLTEEHSTKFNETTGCFPLCERCWRELATPINRLPYYRMLWESWERDCARNKMTREAYGLTPDQWTAIEAAVLAGG